MKETNANAREGHRFVLAHPFVGKIRRWNPVPLGGRFQPMLRILIRNNRHPGRKRGDSALMLGVQDDVGDHGVGGDLGDLREHGLFGVD